MIGLNPHSSQSIIVSLITFGIDPSYSAMLKSTDSSDCVIFTEEPSLSPSSSCDSSIGVIVGAILVVVLVSLKRKGSYR